MMVVVVVMNVDYPEQTQRITTVRTGRISLLWVKRLRTRSPVLEEMKETRKEEDSDRGMWEAAKMVPGDDRFEE